jgi:hypothetical protein
VRSIRRLQPESEQHLHDAVPERPRLRNLTGWGIPDKWAVASAGGVILTTSGPWSLVFELARPRLPARDRSTRTSPVTLCN